MKRASILLTVLASVACSEPLVEFADWTIPVPEGTRIIEYAAVVAEKRTERIELVEDLVVGREAVDPRTMLYLAFDLAVDQEGNLYVADTGNYRVQVFDHQGNFVRTLGRRGQGPGEFQRARQITIARDDLVVHDSVNYKFSIWKLDGTHVGDYAIEGSASLENVTGLNDGSVVAATDVLTLTGAERTIVNKWSLEGTEMGRYAEMPAAPGLGGVTRGGTSTTISIPAPLPSVAGGESHDVYVSETGEYQVHAFSPSGEMTWALRVARSPSRLPDHWVEKSLKILRTRVPDVTRREIAFPDVIPVLSGLQVDGHGHLYVFHYVLEEPRSGRPDPRQPPIPRAVDVYSSDGERLFSGTTTIQRWNASLGDYIYRVETDPQTEERVVVRYRLVEPF